MYTIRSAWGRFCIRMLHGFQNNIKSREFRTFLKREKSLLSSRERERGREQGGGDAHTLTKNPGINGQTDDPIIG